MQAVTAGLWHNSGLGLLWEFHQSHCYSLLQQTAFGMAAYYSFAAATLVLAGPRLFVLLFVWPFVANVGFASVVNWGWHIFADPAAPLNYAASTITVMDWAGEQQKHCSIEHAVRQRYKHCCCSEVWQ
jgi:hypothetical protein